MTADPFDRRENQEADQRYDYSVMKRALLSWKAARDRLHVRSTFRGTGHLIYFGARHSIEEPPSMSLAKTMSWSVLYGECGKHTSEGRFLRTFELHDSYVKCGRDGRPNAESGNNTKVSLFTTSRIHYRFINPPFLQILLSPLLSAHPPCWQLHPSRSGRKYTSLIGMRRRMQSATTSSGSNTG